MDIISIAEEEMFSKHMLDKADLLRIPMMGTFELTPICNMNCEMCYVRQSCEVVENKGGLKRVAFWEKIIDQAIKEGLLFCLLTGGEIFTYPEFKELYEHLCYKGIDLVLNTNGTLITEEIVQWLAQFPPRRINISLYGASDDTYERLCHMKNGFQRVIQAIELLKKYSIDFRIHGVLVPQNIDDYEQIVNICNYYGVKLELSYYMFPPVRKEEMCQGNKARFEQSRMAEIAYRYRKDQCITQDRWKKFVEDKCDLIEHPEKYVTYGANCVTCRAGSSSFWVNWKGELSGCGVEDAHFISLENKSFKDAWKEIVHTTENITLSETCATCPYRCICPTCMAAAYCETGRLDGTPEYLCEFSKIYAEMLFAERDRLRAERETE